MAAFTAATEVKPDYTEAYYSLGTVRQQQGDLSGAIAAFRAALKYTPNAPEVHNTLGAALRQKGETAAAQVEFQEARRLNKLKADMQAAVFSTNTGIALLKEGKLAEAIERLESAISSDPTNAQAHYHLALALIQKGDRTRAAAAYERAKQLDPRLKPLP